MRSSLLLLFFLVSAVSCVSAGRPVFYHEMETEPYLDLDKDKNVMIILKNSKIHSGLYIQSIDYKIDDQTKNVIISAIQGPVKNTKRNFNIKINKTKAMSYQYYWKDPDGKNHKLGFG